VKLRDTPRRRRGKYASYQTAPRVHLFQAKAIAVQWKHHRSLNCFITTRFRRATGLTLLQKNSCYDKKYWNAAARHLSDPSWHHHPLSRWHRSNRDGSRSTHSGRFDFDRQVVHALQFLLTKSAETKLNGAQRGRYKSESTTYSAPTAAEISKTTMLSEMKIWIIANTFAQRASRGASVGPNVELWVNATNK